MESNVIFPELPTYVGVPSPGGALSVLVVLVLPIVAAWFMRPQWSPFTKGLILLACAAVKVFLEAWIVSVDASTPFDFAGAAYTVVVQFAMAVVAYFGLLKGTKVQRAALVGGVVHDRRAPTG